MTHVLDLRTTSGPKEKVTGGRGKTTRRGIFKYAFLDKHRSSDIAVGVATGLHAGRPGNRNSLPRKGNRFPLQGVRQAVGKTQTLFQCALGGHLNIRDILEN